MRKNLKISVSRLALAGAVAILINAAPAFAQQEKLFNTPPFTPIASWEVGSTQLSSVRGLASMKLPCVISNEYDNGFVVRFSGGGGQWLAMAIDFRQDVFTQGVKYDATLAVDNSYMKQATASAFTTSTLIFNLRPLPDFYKAVQQGQQMEMDVEGNKFIFSLAGLNGAYAQLESCYNGTKTETIKPMIETAAIPQQQSSMPASAIPAVETAATSQEPSRAELPRSYDEIVRNTDSGPAQNSTSNIGSRSSAQKPPAAIAARQSPAVDMAARTAARPAAAWTAKAGEDVQTVLRRWADKADYNLEWQAETGTKVTQDVMINGSFEEAVTQLLAESGAVTGIASHIENGTSPVTPAVAKPVSLQAGPGDSLETVMNQWAAKADAKLIWKTNHPFVLKRPVMAGNFETAVQAALDQYQNDPIRPVADLNIDPQTGRKTLSVFVDR